MSAPERIWTASTDGKCHVGFDTPSMNYTNEYIRKDASDAAIAAARAEGVREGMMKAADIAGVMLKMSYWLTGKFEHTGFVADAIRAAAEAQP